jgi:hypothetical protein
MLPLLAKINRGIIPEWKKKSTPWHYGKRLNLL